MENEVLVEVQNVSKRFCKDLKRSIRYGFMDSLRALSGKDFDSTSLRADEFWAVKDISFTLRRGECLGLIGHNGAGKSTLLKMLNGLMSPDHGKIVIRGKIGALIELGAGFNPILTGRENIYNNAAVLGFSKEEIGRKFEEIVAFSEVGEFLDMPVQNYSSGMKVRLGFAIAAQMEPDVLIIDEVLAVGDIGFRTKCLNRIAEMLEKCVTIFVSHSMPQVARTTNRIILMKKGECLIDTDNISLGIQKYYSNIVGFETERVISGNGKIGLIDFFVNEKQILKKPIEVKYSKQLVLTAKLNVNDEVTQYFISYGFIDVDTKIVANLFSSINGNEFGKKGIVEVSAVIDSLELGAGNFILSISINQILPSGNRGEVYYYNSNLGTITVIDVITAVAPVQFLGVWKEHII